MELFNGGSQSETVINQENTPYSIEIDDVYKHFRVYKDKGSERLAVILSIKGYDSSKPMSVAVGFDEEGNILKCSVISCLGETKGIGSKVSDADFLEQFEGKSDVDDIDGISRATISSSAFKSGIADACAAVRQYRAEVAK